LPFRRSPAGRTAANLLTRDEARRIAANIAKLRCPDLGIYRCCIVSLYRFRPHPQASFRLPGHAFFVVLHQCGHIVRWFLPEQF
jgi:hypothetical protein